jgi:NADPH2:quinone reductase
MHTMVVHELGGPRALIREEHPRGAPGPMEVAIEVEAIGCNFFDVLITEGKYQRKPSLPFAPGGEAVGRVRAVGAGVSRVKVGDRVLGLPDFGAYASDLILSERRVFFLPDDIPPEHGVALGIVYQTAHVALVERAMSRPGETLLVHAAAGGVGLAAVQIGRALGATVIGAAGSEAKLELARAHGAHHALDYRDPAWASEVKRLTAGRGVDVVFDPVGGDIFDGSTRCIAFGGRIVVIGFASGRIPSLEMNRVLLKNIAAVGLHWGAYFDHRPEVIARTHDALIELYRRGGVRPLIAERHPLGDATKALEALRDRKTVGKVVLIP